MAEKKAKPATIVEEETVEEVVVAKKPEAKKKPIAEKKSVSGKTNEGHLLAAIGYVIGIFAIILYLLKPDDKYVRFHALQSVLLWVGVIVVMVIFGFITMILGFIPVINVLACVTGIVAAFFWIFGLIAALYCAWKSYNGEEYELPYIGEIAKKHA